MNFRNILILVLLTLVLITNNAQALGNGTYDINASATGYTTTTDTVTVVGGEAIKILLLYPAYNLTINARDCITLGQITSFTAYKSGVGTSTTNGVVTYAVTYGLFDVSVTANGYTPVTESIFVTEDTTQMFDLCGGQNLYYPKWYVSFYFMNYNGAPVDNVNVTISNAALNVSKMGFTGTDGRIVFELIQDQPYILTATKGTVTKTVTVYPGYQVYAIGFNDMISEFDELTWYLNHSNTTIYFTVIDPNSYLINSTVTIGNASTASLYTSTQSGTYIIYSYSPPNLSSPYLVTYTFNTTTGASTTSATWINMTTGYIQKIPVPGIPQLWMDLTSLFLVTTIMLLGGARHSGKIIILAVLFAGFLWYIQWFTINPAIIAIAGVMAFMAKFGEQ